MKTHTMVFLSASLMTSCLFSQRAGPTHNDSFRDDIERWRTNILEDLKTSGNPLTLPEVSDPRLKDLGLIKERLLLKLPKGQIFVKKAGVDPGAHMEILEQVETLLSETSEWRRLKITELHVDLLESREAAVLRLAKAISMTQAKLYRGTPSSRPVGQVSYFRAESHERSAVILFIRENALCKVFCKAPVVVIKDPKRRDPKGRVHTEDPSDATIRNDQDCEDLAHAIDLELSDAMGR